jgi:hypothetical protein
MSRMDDLAGKNYRIIAFRDLPVSHQLAIAHYMAIDGEAWDILFDASVFGAEAAKAALVATLPDYVREYGDSAWGVVDIPVDSVKRAVLADEELASSFSSWKDYAAWYCKGGIPEHGPVNRWPVILSSSDDETLQDGWHRLHSYVHAGHADIPAVFYPEQWHRNT